MKTQQSKQGEEGVIEERGFGPHLTIDGYGCDQEKLTDLDLVFTILDELPEMINMNKIMPPYVVRYKGVDPLDWGISGIVMIAESHICIHTFPEKNYVSIDIFSCQPFDVDFAYNYFKKAFNFDKIEKHLVMRGKYFPKT